MAGQEEIGQNSLKQKEFWDEEGQSVKLRADAEEAGDEPAVLLKVPPHSRA